MVAEFETIDHWVELGYRRSFPKHKTHLKQLVVNTSIDEYVAQAEQFAKKCSRRVFRFKSSIQEIRVLSTNMDYILAYLWRLGVRDLQSNAENGQSNWRQISWLGGRYVKLKLASTRYRQYLADREGAGMEATATFHLHAAIVRNFLRLGDIESALETSQAINDLIAINGYYDFNDLDVPCCTGALVVTLVLERHDLAVADALKQRFMRDELVIWFYKNWDTDDLGLLKSRLELLCDRHTQMSRYYTNKATYEFPRIDYFYDISEVLSVLRLRQLSGKSLPDLSHTVLNTPMGVLMDKAPVETIDVYETVINRCIDEFNKAVV
jgi:hypothetical protein